MMMTVGGWGAAGAVLGARSSGEDARQVPHLLGPGEVRSPLRLTGRGGISAPGPASLTEAALPPIAESRRQGSRRAFAKILLRLLGKSPRGAGRPAGAIRSRPHRLLPLASQAPSAPLHIRLGA